MSPVIVSTTTESQLIEITQLISGRTLSTAIPQHFRIKGKPGWMGTPDEYEAEVKKLGLKVNVLKPEIAKTYTLTK